MRTCGLSIAVGFAAFIVASDVAYAAPNAAQRKELVDIRRDLGKVPGLIRAKKVAEAGKIISDAEKRLQKVVTDAKLTPFDRTVRGLQQLIQRNKAVLLRARGNNPVATSISYEKQVAPILKAKCAGCHGNNRPKGSLRLDTVAGIQKGGDSGGLINAGNPAGSLLYRRLIATGDQRMPKGGRLSPLQIQTIGLWITQGAKFDGQSAAVAKKTPMAKPKPKVKVTIAKPTGEETVSFTKDIAPFMVNLCLNCHNDRRKSGGYSIETFESLMQGGKSGRVVLPGDLDGSRMWDLVGKQRPFKMPRGQARITRTNWNNLQTWIKEGAKFDGKDPKGKLRALVPTEEELKEQRFAKMSAEQFAQFRRKRMEELWDRVLPKEKPQQVETKEFFVFGNGSKTRLEEIGKWAEAHAAQLQKIFRGNSSPMFKGKLAIVVMKDRFSYEEWNLIINRREVPKALCGHSQVDPLFEDAYIVVQDLGDNDSQSTPGMKVNLIDHLTGAFMKRGGDKLPEWILRGTGLAIAAQTSSKNAYIDGLRAKVPGILQTVQKPEAIFAKGTFSPADVEAVGYTLVDFMLRAGGSTKFGQFISSIQKGNSVNGALKSVYQTNPAALARSYAASLSKKPSKRRKR